VKQYDRLGEVAMSQITLFETNTHKNILLEDYSEGEMIPANQHLIIHKGKGMLLDPGGHKVHTKVFAELNGLLSTKDLHYLFFSHQDPDVVAAANFWFMMTDAEGLISTLWTRFITHFGVDKVALERITSIPDEGMIVELEGQDILLIPAHFLHSSGNFQVYDPVSKILYSGDLGASIDTEYRIVNDFDTHIPYIEGFHTRYMATNKAYRLWAKMVRQLDVEIIAPQHGAVYQGKENVNKFIDWVESLACGLDIMDNIYRIPERMREREEAVC